MAFNDLISRTNAGALIPEEVAGSIIQDVAYQSAALSMFRRVTMSRKQQRMPVLSALPTAGWLSADNSVKPTSNQAWVNKYLNAEPLAVIVPIPEDVLSDSDFDIWTEVRPRLIEAFAVAIDSAVFFGTNKPSSWPDDISTAAIAAGNTYATGTSGVDIAEDVNQVMKLVESDGFDVDGFIAKNAMKATFRGLRDANRQPIFQPSLVAGTPNTLYGERIEFLKLGSWTHATVDLIAGDFTQGIMAVRQDISYKILTEATLVDGSGLVQYALAQQDMVALRAVGRFAFQVANPLTRAANASGWSPTGTSTTYPFGVLT